MIEVFNEYVNNYDMNNPKIKLKYDHSIRVMELSLKYARLLGFNKEDINLAYIIGLLHDIGRFEQAKRYDSFVDLETIDHADLGCEILFEENIIEKFNIDEKYYEIIKKAIRNHNKHEIESGLNEKELLHAKLIRDTDKLDILYNMAYLKQIKVISTDEAISLLVLEDVKNKRCVNNKHIKNNNDKIVRTFTFAFNIYNDICLKEVKEYFEVIYENLEHKEKIKEVYDMVISYIEEKIY